LIHKYMKEAVSETQEPDDIDREVRYVLLFETIFHVN
jgi:hypothetical protein